MSEYEALAIRIGDYKMIIHKAYYYVDKILLIKERIDKGSFVNLFTRLWHFGRT